MKKTIILGTLLCSVLLVGCTATKKTDKTTKESKTVHTVEKKSTVDTSSQNSNSTTSETTKSTTSQADSLTQTAQQGFDINAISSGNFATLVGTWQNLSKETITINPDGTTSTGFTISGAPNWQDPNQRSTVYSGKAPYAFYAQNGGTGSRDLFALVLFNIGYSNPDGEQSDTSQARFVITQDRLSSTDKDASHNFSADRYFYKIN